MRRALLLLGLLAGVTATGCQSLLGIDTDVGVVGGGDGDAMCGSWQPALFDPCAQSAGPALDLTSGMYTWDTSKSAGGVLSDPGGRVLYTSSAFAARPDGSVMALGYLTALTVRQGALLRVVGSHALVLAATDSITIDGIIDASSHLATTPPGAGAGETAVCAASMAPPTNFQGAAGGGGGGGFLVRGANGGGGNGNPTDNPGTGGDALDPPRTLRAGCPGGAGGFASDVGFAGGGYGGGALALLSPGGVTIGAKGIITTGGAGGAGGGVTGGGGGGGSGGMLWISGDPVVVLGTLAANGGGGGAGGTGQDGDAPSGEDGPPLAIAAAGGAADCRNGGGAGHTKGMPPTPGGLSTSCTGAGGGGGGGSGGYIFIAGLGAQSGVITPTFQPPR